MCCSVVRETRMRYTVILALAMVLAVLALSSTVRAEAAGTDSRPKYGTMQKKLSPAGAKAVAPLVSTEANFAPVADKWAVVIGIGRFADARVPSLRYAAKDAQDFADFLRDEAGGKFKQDHVKVLLNEDATKINIMDMLGDSFLPHAAQPDDLVVIYLSTHGSPAGADINGVNYVVAYDSQINKLFATGIEMKQLLRIIKERVHTNRVVLVLDTCYSGAGAEDHKGLIRANVDGAHLVQGTGNIIITSSKSDQRSWESDILKNSYFTRYFIDSLKREPDKVTLSQAFDQMRNQVQSAVLKDKGQLQTPSLAGNFQGPPLVLGVKSAFNHEAPITVELSSEAGNVNLDKEAGERSVVNFAGYGQHMRSAMQYINEKKLWDAAHVLEQAIKANPQSVEAFLIGADVFDAQERYRESLEYSKRAVLNDESSSQAREKLARAYAKLGEKEEALRQAQKAVTLDPNNSMAHYVIGSIYEKILHQNDKAEQEYRKALELNGLNVRALVGLVRLKKMAGDESAALELLLKKALEADSDDAEARTLFGQILYERGDAAGAEAQIKIAMEHDPDNAILHAERGNILSLQKNKEEEAEKEYKKALELGAGKGYCHFVFGRFLLKQNRLDQAENEFKAAIKLEPGLDDVRVCYADLLVKYRRIYDESEEQYKQALAINPRNFHAYMGLARINNELYKNYAKAEENYRKVININPRFAQGYLELGILLQSKLGRQEEARQVFEQALEIDPVYSEPHFYLAMLLAGSNNEALNQRTFSEFDKACQLQPDCSTYLTKRAWFRSTRLKQYKEAGEDLRKAIKCDIRNAEAHYRLGLLLIGKFGQRKAGELELTAAFEQDPGNKDIKDAYYRYVH